MKKLASSLAVTLCFAVASVTAQTFKWIKGGGSISTIQNRIESASYICTDANNNVYVLSQVGNLGIQADTFTKAQAFNGGSPVQSTTLITSYNCNGQMRWAKLIESYNSAEPFGLAYGGDGSVYVCGRMIGGNKHVGYDTAISSIYWNSYLCRFDTSGAFRWVRFVGDNTSNTSLRTGRESALAVDAQGFIHHYNYMLTGVQIMPGVTSQRGIYDLKYDSQGALITANRLGIDSTWSPLRVTARNASGKVYMTLQKELSLYVDNYALASFSANGGLVWMDTTGSHGFISGLVQVGNSLYTCGLGHANSPTPTFKLGGLTASNTTYPSQYFSVIVKTDTNGVGKWIYKLDGKFGFNVLQDIVALPNGQLAALGSFEGTMRRGNDSITIAANQLRNPLFVVIDTANSGTTAKLLQLNGTGYDDGVAIAADGNGSVYLAGSVDVSLTATGIGSYSNIGGAGDFFVVKYGFTCCTATPTANYNKAVNNTTKTGTFTYTGTTASIDSLVWNWGDGTKTKVTTGFTNPVMHTWTVANSYLVSVTVYSQCGTNTNTQTVQFTTGVEEILAGQQLGMVVYPNPASQQLTVGYNFGSGKAIGTRRVVLYDALGRVMHIQVVEAASGEVSIEVGRIAAAMYIVRMEEGVRAVQTRRLSVSH